MSWLLYLVLIVCAAFAGKLAIYGRNGLQIGIFEKFIAFILLIVFSMYVAYKYWETKSYEGLIPAEVEISDVVFINSESGFREGCGAAIFLLSPEMSNRIASDGLVALENARQGRGNSDSSNKFSVWQKTPYHETGDGLTLADRWLSGLGDGCAGIKGDLAKNIYNALKKDGSFFATTAEGGLIVIPSHRLAIYSYNG